MIGDLQKDLNSIDCKESLKKKLESLCCCCGEKMKLAPGLGQYCKNKKCGNMDGPTVWDIIQRTNYFQNASSMKMFEKWKETTE
jgi:hypothetical protein